MIIDQFSHPALRRYEANAQTVVKLSYCVFLISAILQTRASLCGRCFT